MNLADVMGEVAAALGTISGLQVHDHPPETAMPPCAIVAWPSSMDYDATYGRGADRLTLPVIVAVGRGPGRATWEQLAGYADGSGTASVKAAIESGTYTACDAVRVTRVEFAPLVLGAVELEAAFFDLDIMGAGTNG